MNDDELRAALAPVEDFFKASSLSINSVLAAHLRSHDVQPHGDVWSSAKEAFKQGLSFTDAARVAVEEHGNGLLSKHTELTPPADTTRPPPTPQTKLAPRTRPTNRDRLGEDASTNLDWFAKPFSPGDIDGDGARRLLGAPNIPMVSVLTRETAQNSWDARTGKAQVVFELHLRELDQASISILREKIFTGDSTGLGLQEVLNRDTLWVLEVADRGTSGLNGPTRNDLVVPEGSPTNFMDLVMNVGAPRDVHLGGGTYGFGKTVAYTASSCGTILLWSRSAEPQGLEHRIIGSAMGPGFDQAPLRFTGRHWWGLCPEEGRVEPLCGDEAEELATTIFERGFGKKETGTSILILDPQLGADTPDEAALRLAEAVKWNLWPKLMEGQAADVEMKISVLLNGRVLDIPGIDEDPILRGFAACLRAVRAAQAGVELPDSFLPVGIREVWLERPKTLLGHLALTRYPTGPSTPVELGDIASVGSPSRHVALMRHSAELIVRYDQRQPIETDGVQWAAVFKPVSEVDDSFAASEPPAHDDWVPRAIANKGLARHVRVAISRLRDLASEFVSPANPIPGGSGTTKSVAGLADSLADLVPSVEGPRPTTKPSSPSSSSSRKPSARIVNYRLGPALPSGLRLTAFNIRVEGTQLNVSVRARCAVGVDGGSDESYGEVAIAGWSEFEPDLSSSFNGPDGPVHVVEGGETWLIVIAKSDIAVDVRVEVEDH